ncbi:MAG: FtsX-like permease family protein [Gemmatimonadota bacterium]|nr:FtsX-like permease family protein [Gemmatimonadota bacterium]MDH5760869.1 FtsX-like permease family protein [Gemmatimonadota bacterium]
MRFLILLRLSARAVGRNLRRSALTAAAMALGLALLVFSRALSDGGHEQWIDSAVRLGTGHVAIQAPEFLETGRLEHRLDSSALRSVERALDDPRVTSAVRARTTHLAVPGLASSAAAALPARIEGVDPALEAAFSPLPEMVQGGEYLQPGDRLKAFIGAEMARRLELEVGERFVLTAQNAEGEVEGQMVRVAGIYRTGIQEMDEGVVHLPLETARTWLSAPGAATTVSLLLGESRSTDEVTETLRAILEDHPEIRVMGWRQASPDLDSAVRIDDYGDYLFHTILFAIVGLAVLNAIMMSVLGRRREFGILQALGLTPAETGWVVFGEGLFLTAVSGVAGMVLGYVVTWGFFRDGLDFSSLMDEEMSLSGGIIETVIVPVFYLKHVLVSVGYMTVIGILASIYPARRATLLDVAEAMKFEQ